jgi:hypothetical protein
MKTIAADLHRTIETARVNLVRIDSRGTNLRPAPGKWSKREILGHLIDSAANNHQRFVRARHREALEFPGYDQDAWVAGQNYNDVDWRDLIELWVLLNRHLVHVILQLGAEDLEKPCRIGDRPAVTLRELIVDYVAHMKHHLGQLAG